MMLNRTAALTMVSLAGCTGIPDATDISKKISRGMNYEEIFVMLSDYEMERDFRGDVTALQYCSGSNKNAEYVTVWFIGDQVEGVTQYFKELPSNERCGWFFAEVDWAQAPTVVKTKLYIE